MPISIDGLQREPVRHVCELTEAYPGRAELCVDQDRGILLSVRVIIGVRIIV